MHPAISVIFFTTTAGAGYGMLMLIGILAPLGLVPADRWFGLVTMGLALGLITAGLLSSTAHLGHPERAWRALTQWRSSWLAREGVAAVIAYVPAGLFALGWVVLEKTQGAWGLFGVFASFMALVTILCTAMIYASLRTIQRWNNALVPPNYLLLGLMSGAVFVSAIGHLFAIRDANIVDGFTIAFVAFAWALKTAYWRFIDNSRAIATPQTATGLRYRGPVRQLDPPHMMENYLLKEMGYRIARRHADKLRRLTHLTAFALPLVLLAASIGLSGIAAMATAVLAALSASVGVVVERWLFFAEARHTVMLYYGEQRV